MLHCGSRQCGLQADAADPHVSPREGRGTDGQKYNDAQGHPRASGKQPSFGEVSSSSWASLSALRSVLLPFPGEERY